MTNRRSGFCWTFLTLPRSPGGGVHRGQFRGGGGVFD